MNPINPIDIVIFTEIPRFFKTIDDHHSSLGSQQKIMSQSSEISNVESELSSSESEPAPPPKKQKKVVEYDSESSENEIQQREIKAEAVVIPMTDGSIDKILDHIDKYFYLI